MSEPEGHYLDLDSWPRRAQFDFYRRYTQPFFSVCAEVEVTETRRWCRDNGRSFAMACWFVCQRCVNAAEPFRYRLRGDRVWVHDRIRVATTFLNADETFRFAYIPFAETFDAFEAASRAILAAPSTPTMDDRPEDDAVIHGSTLPWLRFTSITHARDDRAEDAVPKIVFGRYDETSDRVMMPMSVAAHHALMDGLHVSRLFQAFEAMMADPEGALTA